MHSQYVIVALRSKIQLPILHFPPWFSLLRGFLVPGMTFRILISAAGLGLLIINIGRTVEWINDLSSQSILKIAVGLIDCTQQPQSPTIE